MKLNCLLPLTVFSTIQTCILVYIFRDSLSSIKTLEMNRTVEAATTRRAESQADLVALFHSIISSIGIDKLYHRYHTLYGVYLGPRRHQELNFLEIGLGCTMKYGAGKSLIAWRRYLTHPKTRISFVEYDRKCAEKFAKNVTHMFIGDQSNFGFLERVGIEGGPYDFIVDDGGHKRTFQINSFLGLWPHVKKGGIYVIEDLFFSFYKNFDNSNETAIDMVYKLIMLMNDANQQGSFMIPVKMKFSPKLVDAHRTISSIHCFNHACVFVKA